MASRSSFWTLNDAAHAVISYDLGAGATLLLAIVGGRVHVHLSAPPGVDIASRRARIGAQLAARLLLVNS